MVPEAFRSALPKSMYWIGTSISLNHTISSLWCCALTGTDTDNIAPTVADEMLAAAVRFAHLRYLAGQSVLAVFVKGKVWGKEIAHATPPGDLLPVLVRILTGTPGSFSTMDTIKSLDLKLKRDLRFPGTASYSAARQRLEQLWRMIADIGMGRSLDDLLVQILCDGCLNLEYS